MRKFNWAKLLLGVFVVAITLLVIFAFSATAAGEKVIYTVKPGDTLGELMYTWRVQGVEINKIHVWNSDLGTQVKVGQKITYYLPERVDVKKLTDQEIQKVVAETMARMEKPKEPAPVTQPVTTKATSNSTETLKLSAIALAIAAVLLAFIGFLLRRRKNQAKAKEEKVVTSLETKDVEADNETGAYMVKVTKKSDGKWHTPFATLEDSAKPLFRADFQGAKKAVRGCVKDLRYADQFKRLLAAGDGIRKK